MNNKKQAWSFCKQGSQFHSNRQNRD
uniref:Uncharacterized protein n=1 Tax=Arundo donax TaxID=35708 RepID=A0A0A9DIZ3_ARUDO